MSPRVSSWSLLVSVYLVAVCFFFQAEDGIRDATVTGVQTCALPIAGPGRVDERAGRAAGDGQARPRRLPEEPARADPGRRTGAPPRARGLGVRQALGGPAGHRGAGEAQAGLPAEAGAPAGADPA